MERPAAKEEPRHAPGGGSAAPGAPQQPGTSQPSPSSPLATLLDVLDQLAAEDRKQVFKAPVVGVRGYHERIATPMCFDQMREKLSQNQYGCLRAFYSDVELIFENAKTFNAPGHPIHKLAVSMQKTARKQLQARELECRRALYALHPQGPAAAAEQESAHVRQLAAFDAEQAQSILQAAAAAAAAAAPPPPPPQQQQQQQRSLRPRPENLAAAHALFEGDRPQAAPSDAGLLFSAQPAPSFDGFVHQLQQGVLYQPHSSSAQQPQRRQRQQQRQQQQQRHADPQAAASSPGAQQQPLAWRCQWLHTRMLELQSLIGLLQAPGSTVRSIFTGSSARPPAPPPAAAGARGDSAGTGAQQQQRAVGALSLQVQQHGHLLQQHVDALPVPRIRRSPFFAAHAPAADAGGGAEMDVDPPAPAPRITRHQQQLQHQQQQAAQDSKAAAAAAAADAVAAASSALRAVFAPAQHPADAALMFTSLEVVERQLVAARLAVGRAFAVDACLAPPGVRLGQYASARLVGPDGVPLVAAASGTKRGAGGALGRGASGALGGARGLARDGSGLGSFKKRRLTERSGGGLATGMTASMDDECVVSPSASSRLVERAAVAIHIPPVRELPPEQRAALKAAATTWHQAVKAHGARHAMTRPPPEVRAVLDAALRDEGSSSEDTSDSAFERLHAPLLEEERVRLNPAGGGRKRNQHKGAQQGSKQERDTGTSHQQDEPASPPAATQRQRAKKTGAAERGAASGPSSGAAAAAGPGGAAGRSTATSGTPASAGKRSQSPKLAGSRAGNGGPASARHAANGPAAGGAAAAHAPRRRSESQQQQGGAPASRDRDQRAAAREAAVTAKEQHKAAGAGKHEASDTDSDAEDRSPAASNGPTAAAASTAGKRRPSSGTSAPAGAAGKGSNSSRPASRQKRAAGK